MRRIAFLAALLWATAAQADMGLMLLGAQSPPHYPLDGITTPTACYSWRRLRTAYSTNKAMNVVRASDSATSDIGFTADGRPDTATLATFCNATTCKLVTAYDQCGSNNETQATDANRPAIVQSCIGTLPCAQMTTATMGISTGNVTPATGLVSFNMVANRAAGTGACGFNRQNGLNNRLAARGANANQWILAGGTSGTVIALNATDAAWHSGSAVLNGASSSINVDGTIVTGTATGNTTAGGISSFGIASTTCDVAEQILWDNYALTTAEQAYLVPNQRAAWGF